MVYDHMVKVNGQYYQAGENVPEIKKTAGNENLLPFSDDYDAIETKEDNPYTKSEIQRMNKAELQELAKNTGIDGSDNMTGAELKESLFSVFGL